MYITSSVKAICSVFYIDKSNKLSMTKEQYCIFLGSSAVCVVANLGPVRSIGDVVEVPAGREDGVESTCCHLLHLILPASLPHIYHCVGQHLWNTYCPVILKRLD